jgi:hypothetical protein
MKLLAIGINFQEGFTFARQVEPREGLTDEDVIQFMVDCNQGELLDQVILVTSEDDGEELMSEELIQ